MQREVEDMKSRFERSDSGSLRPIRSKATKASGIGVSAYKAALGAAARAVVGGSLSD
jgi:hypothetical protein|tara:strand:- start:268 stop:438 length:171 start_codon:yes stop_codon:yes gene_type:complete